MGFAIEVPGEANPLNQQNLVHTLAQASSNNQQQLKTGTQQLTNWEKIPGYYSSLQAIFIEKSYPVELRYICAIQIKNGVEKYWRKMATNAITKEEKDLIKSRCIDAGLREPDDRLSLQNALFVAKLVRYDFPHDWPDAIHRVMIKTNQAVHEDEVGRCLQILLYVIKELATARLQRNRTNLQATAPEIFSTVATKFVGYVTEWMEQLTQSGQVDRTALMSRMPQSLLCMRVVRRLLVSGYQHPNRDVDVAQFWTIMNTKLNQILALLQHDLPRETKYLLERHVMQFAKLHLDMARSSPAGFALLPDSVGLAKSYWNLISYFGRSFGSSTLADPNAPRSVGDKDDEVSILEKISLKGLLLLRACAKMVYDPVHTFRFRHPEDKEEEKRSKAIIRADLLTDAFAQEVMETLVTRFFVYRPRDLREWQEEPDEWERREEGEGDVWEFSVRSCSEKLFLDVVINHKDVLVEPLLRVFESVANISNTDIFLKDSIYGAIGLAAPVLEKSLDFDAFLSSTLVPEVQKEGPGYNILRRRIAIILGQWLPVKEGLDRALVYQIFQYLLDETKELNDQVVRVTAGRQLANVIDPFEFTAALFVPYAADILKKLMKLVHDVEPAETKLSLLTTVSIAVTKMEHHISPFADLIMSSLPPLWDQAGEEYLLKQSILGILSGLVTSMKQDSQKYTSLIVPLIHGSIEPNSETRQYLLEEALDLWSSVLENTPQPCPPEIAGLASHLFPMFDSASDTLIKALEVTEVYTYLNPERILSSKAQFFSAWAPLLTSIKIPGVMQVTGLIELLIRQAFALGADSAVEQVSQALYEYNIIHTLLLGLKDAHSAHQTTGPNKAYSHLDSQVETEYLSILARIALASPPLLLSMLATFDTESGTTGGDTLHWLLEEWFSHFDDLISPDRKKLSCLALTALLSSSASPTVLKSLQSLMSVQTDTITELMDAETGADSLVMWPRADARTNGDESWSETSAEFLKRELLLQDPVRRVDIRDHVRGSMGSVIRNCGGEARFREQWLVNVDQDVVRAFGELRVL